MKPLFLKNEDGFVLAKVMILAGIGLAITAGSLKLIDNRVNVAKIMNARARMSMLETRIVNAATSLNAYYTSAQKAHGNSDIRKCMKNNGNGQCDADHHPKNITLFNSFGEQISGNIDINGLNCQDRKNCDTMFNIDTDYEIVCPDDASYCTFPELIKTRYTIRQVNTKYTSGVKFPEIKGIAELVTYMCPAGQFVRAIDANGKFICSAPEASLFSVSCPSDSVAYGVTPQGDLLCSGITNFCSKKLALATVIDTSGSMSGSRMSSAISAGKDFVDYLQSMDQSGIVEFNTSSSILSDLSGDKTQLHQVLGKLRATGTTNMAAALSNAAKVLQSAPADAVKGIVFLSDGWYNEGGSPFTMAKNLKAQGVKIWTIGLGEGADTVTLRQLASSPQDYYFAKNPGDLQGTFENISSALCRTAH